MKGKRILAALLALVMVLSTTTVIFAKDWSEKQTFKDVGRRDWSHGYVENLADQDIVHGYGDGTYGPLDNLTRQQAAKMIAIAAGLDFKGKTAKFPDVPKDSEFSGYIAALVEKGAISGFTDGTFRPTALITRSQAAKMIAAAFGLAKGDFDVDFPDTKDLDPKDKALVDLLASLGIVKGYEDGKEFRPFNNVSRAQFAKMLAIAQATAAVQRAEADGATDADLAQAKKLVDNLPDNQDIGTKKSLEGRLDDLEEEEEEPGPGPVVVQVSAISVDKTALYLDLATNKTATVTATVSPGNATNKNVTWSSSDKTKVTVDANGNVTAVAEGEATITATSNNGKKATTTVTVLAEPLQESTVAMIGTTQYDSLREAVDVANDSKAEVIMIADVTIAGGSGGYGVAGLVLNGAIINGNGNTLTVTDANATWNCAIYTTGGTIKNLTIGGAFRGIFTAGCSEDIIIDNVMIDNTCYTFSSDGSNSDHSVIVTNSTLNGWTSYTSGYKSVSFTNSNFGKGTGAYQYAFMRPYSGTEFNNCEFSEGYVLDATKTTDDITLYNCTVGGVKLTQDNLTTLLGANAATAKVDG